MTLTAENQAAIPVHKWQGIASSIIGVTSVMITLLLIGLFGGNILVALGGFSVWPIVITASALLTFGLTLGLAWLRHARGIVSACDLLFAPAYALSKIPTLWRFLTKRQVVWIKTERDPD